MEQNKHLIFGTSAWVSYQCYAFPFCSLFKNILTVQNGFTYLIYLFSYLNYVILFIYLILYSLWVLITNLSLKAQRRNLKSLLENAKSIYFIGQIMQFVQFHTSWNSILIPPQIMLRIRLCAKLYWKFLFDFYFSFLLFVEI